MFPIRLVLIVCFLASFASRLQADADPVSLLPQAQTVLERSGLTPTLQDCPDGNCPWYGSPTPPSSPELPGSWFGADKRNGWITPRSSPTYPSNRFMPSGRLGDRVERMVYFLVAVALGVFGLRLYLSGRSKPT